MNFENFNFMMISRFASIGPVAGAPNLGYLEVINSDQSTTSMIFHNAFSFTLF